ncbi:RloB family protein [Pedobacter aquatilis]|uniref:RloB family protein n=1 Tax=Pedobacter aquatilis TaxID=351343 RepID=UPI00293064E4|nr:RloB family protein [Pedobacter aquatilis]
MLSRSRTYVRQDPDKDAKLFLIFCEGSKTEPKYFNYFNLLNSRIRIEAVPADSQGNNSPSGLMDSAMLAIVKSKDNPNPEYELNAEDEVWFVIDTDQWGAKIDKLRADAANFNWQVAQSNPCFEVWLYYHFYDVSPSFSGHEQSSNWKPELAKLINGGFHLSKHPIFIQTAIEYAKKNFTDINVASCTEVHILAERFISLIKTEIDGALAQLP